MPTTPHPFATPNGPSRSTEPNLITQSPSTSNGGSLAVGNANGLELLSSVVADNEYSPAIQIYNDGLTSQAPVTMSPTQAIVPTIAQTSPGVSGSTQVTLFQDKASLKCPSSSFNPVNIEKNTNLGRVLTIPKHP